MTEKYISFRKAGEMLGVSEKTVLNYVSMGKLTANGKSVCLKKKDQKGIMLSERYIQGKFFLEKGAQSAKPRIERACDSWLRDTLREAIGALL